MMHPILLTLLKIQQTVFAFLLFVLLLLIISFSTLVEKSLVYWLESQGAKQASIQAFDLNLWQGEIQLKGLRFHMKQAAPFYLDDFKLKFAWPNWQSPKIILQQVQLNNSQFQLKQHEQNWLLNGLKLPLSAQASPEPAPEQSASAALPWQIDQLQLNHIRFQFSQPNLTESITINHCQLDQLDSEKPNQDSQFSCHITRTQTQQTAHLATDLSMTPLADARRFKGKVRLTNWDLHELTPWLPADTVQIAGLFNSQIQFNTQLTASQFNGQLVLNNRFDHLSLQQADIQIQNQAIHWTQQTDFKFNLPSLDQLQAKGKIVFDLAPTQIATLKEKITFKQLHHQLEFDSQRQTDHLTGQLQLNTQFSQLALQQGDTQLNNDALSWAQQTDFSLNLPTADPLQAKGQITLELAQTQIATLKEKIAFKQLKHQLQFDTQRQKAQLSGQLQLDTQLNQLALQQGDTQLNNDTLNWTQQTNFTLPINTPEQAEISAQLDLKLSDSKWQTPQLSGKLAQTLWQGQATWQAQQPTLAGHLTLTHLNSQLADQPLLGWQAFSSQIQLPNLNRLELTDSQLDGLTFGRQLDQAAPQLQLAQTTLKKLTFDQTQALSLDLHHLTLTDLQVAASFNDQNELLEIQPLLAALKQNAASPAPQNAETTPPAQSQPLLLNLEQLNLAGDHNRLILKHPALDHSQPQTLAIKQLSLSQLHPQQPNQVSSLKFDATFNEFTQLQLAGEGSWLNPMHQLNLNLNIDDLNLTPFSPLIQPVLDEEIQQGNLSSQSQIKIQQGQLDSKNHLVLSQFELNKSAENTPPPAEDDLTANEAVHFSTLNYSLNILRDKNNQITLDLPVKGDIQSPEFEFKSVFKTALYKAIAFGSKQLILLSIQPYSTFYSIGELAYGLATEIRLQPIEFQPGLVKFAKEQPDYLPKIQQLMLKQPNLHLKLCGEAGEKDQTLLTAQLKPAKGKSESTGLATAIKTLNKQRQDQIKKQLVELGIESKRITTCLADDKIKEEQGKVTLGF